MEQAILWRYREEQAAAEREAERRTRLEAARDPALRQTNAKELLEQAKAGGAV